MGAVSVCLVVLTSRLKPSDPVLEPAQLVELYALLGQLLLRVPNEIIDKKSQVPFSTSDAS